MHMYTKCDQNIPCGSRVMNIFTNCYWMDGRTDGWMNRQTYRRTDSHSDYSADPRVVQFQSLVGLFIVYFFVYTSR